MHPLPISGLSLFQHLFSAYHVHFSSAMHSSSFSFMHPLPISGLSLFQHFSFSAYHVHFSSAMHSSSSNIFMHMSFMGFSLPSPLFQASTFSTKSDIDEVTITKTDKKDPFNFPM